jgi:hypothetical protein
MFNEGMGKRLPSSDVKSDLDEQKKDLNNAEIDIERSNDLAREAFSELPSREKVFEQVHKLLEDLLRPYYYSQTHHYLEDYFTGEIMSNKESDLLEKISPQLHAEVLYMISEELYQHSSQHHHFDWLRGSDLTFLMSDTAETARDIRKKTQEQRVELQKQAWMILHAAKLI